MNKDTKKLILGIVFTAVGALIISLLSIAASIKDSISIIYGEFIFSRFAFMGNGVIILYPLFFIGLIMFVAGLIILIKELLSVTSGKIRKAIYKVLSYDGHKKGSNSDNINGTDAKSNSADNK